MTHYFGFIPSDKLNAMIDEADDIISSKKQVDYYPYRDKLAKQIAQEIIENLLVNLIEVIPNSERQASMRKIVNSIENATDTMLGVLLGKDKNEDILPTFEFLKQQSIFIDNEGHRRIGFKLDDATAQRINEGFDAVTPESVDMLKFKDGLETMNHAILDHFITKFTATLKLGMFKRKAVPVAKVAIDKGLNMAINKLFPQLPDEALNRLVNFYRPYMIKIDNTDQSESAA